jgi:integrase
MATIRKRAGKWQAQVRRKGETFSRTFMQKADAQRWANQAELDADRKGLQADLASLRRITVADLVVRFRDAVIPKRRGREIETIVINAFLRQSVARVRLSDLTPNHFATYRDERLKLVKAGTVLRELGLIQHIFEVAKTEWYVPLALNPLKAIRKPKADRPRERRLIDNERQSLDKALAECRNPLVEQVVRFALATGMRRGEILNARWQDLNLAAKTLHIPLTKNGEPRTIPLSSEALSVLEYQSTKKSNVEDRIFPTTAEAVKLAWQRLTKRAGIVDLHFHDLRHEAVSRFFERGLTVPEVALISGHKDPRMLFRYTHLKAEDIARKLNPTQ